MIQVNSVDAPQSIMRGDNLNISANWSTDQSREVYLTYGLYEPPDYNTYSIYTSTQVDEFSPGTYVTDFKPVPIPADAKTGLHRLKVMVVKQEEGTLASKTVDITIESPAEPPPEEEKEFPWKAVGIGLGASAILGGLFYWITKKK